MNNGGDLQLDKQIEAIQKSTRTLIAAFSPIHNWLRLNIRWYYKWHTKSYAKTLHWVILAIYIFSLPIILLRFGQESKITLASGTASFPRWVLENPKPTSNALYDATTCSQDGSFWTVGANGTILKSIDSGTTWQQTYTGLTDDLNRIYCISNINIVAVGKAGTILQYDGISWTKRAVELTDQDLNDVTYANNRIVAVGNGGTIVESNDGIHWSLKASPSSDDLNGVAGEGDHFIIVGNAGTILFSDNNSDWETVGIGVTSVRLKSAIVSGQNFIAVGNQSTIIQSSDGTNWIERNQNLSGGELKKIVYGNDLYVAIGTPGTSGSVSISFSPDGSEWWNAESVPGDAYFYGLNFINGKFYVVGHLDDLPFYIIGSSSDGSIWNFVEEGMTGSPQYAVIGDSNCIVTTGTLMLQQCGEGDWQSVVTTLTTETLSQVVYNNGNFVSSTMNGELFRSTDGSNWSQVPGLGDYQYQMRTISESGGFFFASGNCFIIRSSDGQDWEQIYSCSGDTIVKTIVFNNRYIAITSQNKILESPDGETWTERYDAGRALNDIYSTGNSVVAIGNYVSAVSSDGTTWDGGDSIGSVSKVIYNNNTYLALGLSGVDQSSDGVNWVKVKDRIVGTNYLDIVANSEGFVLVGSDGFINHSSDGTTWDNVSGVTNYDLVDVGVKDNNFIAVGDQGSVFQSSDGISWVKKTNGLTGSTLDDVASSATDIIAVGSGGAILHYYSPANATANKLMVTLPGQNFSDENPTGNYGTATTAKAGVPISIKTYAVDATSNNKLDRGFAYQATLSSSDPAASSTLPFSLDNSLPDLSCSSTDDERISNPCGIGAVSYTFHTVGTWTVTAQDAAGSGLTSGTSVPIEVLPGSPSKVSFTNSPQAVAGAPTEAITFKLQDLYGNDTTAESDIAVRLTSDDMAAFSSSSSGPWSNTLDFVIPTGASVGSFYYLNYAQGSHDINVYLNSSSTSAGSTKITIIHGPIDPIKSSILLSSSSVVANNTPVNITITLLDNLSNKVAGKTLTISSSRTEDSIANPSSQTDSRGQAVGTIKSTKTGESAISVYDQTDNIYLPSVKLNFTPGSSEKMILEGPAETEAGVPFSINLTLKDKYDNLATDSANQIEFSSNDSIASLPEVYTFAASDQGSHIFESIIFKTAGIKTLALKSGELSSSLNVLVKPTKLSVANSGFSLNPLVIKADSKDQANGTINLKDSFNNILPSREISLISSLTTVTILPLSILTDSNGEASFVLTASSPGSAIITALDKETSQVIGTKTLTVSSTSPDKSKLTVSLSVTSIKANGKDQAIFTLELKDSSSSPIPRENLIATTSRPQYDTIVQLTSQELKNLQSEGISLIPRAHASTPSQGITIQTDDTGKAQFKFTSEREGASIVNISWPATGLVLASFNIDVQPLTLTESAKKVVTDIISSISSSPVAKRIASITEPIISTVATISILPIIANVFSTVPQVFNFFSYLSVSILETIGIKRRRQPWGRVYDAITGNPVDLAVVRIFNEKKKLIETRVTDFEGRFGFLVPKGKYTVAVTKEAFKFPSHIAEARATRFNDKYQLNSDIYLGQPIAVSEQNANINLDIPVDPILTGSNLKAKIRLGLRLIIDWFQIIISYLAKPFLFVGIIMSIFNYTVNQTTKNMILLFIYLALLIFLFFKYRFEAKSYGQVLDEKTQKPITDALVSIYDKEYNTLRQSQTTDKLGRFHFLVKPGTYYLSVNASGYVMEKELKKKKSHHIYNGSNIAYSKPGYINVEIFMRKNHDRK